VRVQTKFYQVDVTDEARIEEAVGEVVEDFGAIDILLNNAGIYYPTPVVETSLEDWQRILEH
jgi:3-hydroxybutyrate dehydrogenase